MSGITRFEIDYESFLSQHDVVYKSPVEPREYKTGENFIDGPLLGNGDVGLVVHGTPDKCLINISKNDVWDRRLGPDGHALPDIGQVTQRELLEAAESDKLEELETSVHNYRKVYNRSWDVPPLPKPVGQVVLSNPDLVDAEFDQGLSLHDARVESSFTTSKTKVSVSTFVSAIENQIFIRYRHQGKNDLGLIFDLYRWNDRVDKTMTVPEVGYERNRVWINHRFPKDAFYPEGFQYTAFAAVGGAEVQAELLPNIGRLRILGTRNCDVLICIGVSTSRDSQEPFIQAKMIAERGLSQGYDSALAVHKKWWHDFWSKSFIHISDGFMENMWYMGQYLLACCSREGKVAPGLYGCWITNDSSAWHGDYHLDYNFQQSYWGVYSSNHLELAATYYNVIESFLAEAKSTAKNVYNCRGAAFPIIAFPVKNGYKRPKPYPWDRIMAVTAWVTQGFWWHYKYTLDQNFLKERAYPLMVECARFYQDFLKKENGKYVICPTVSPEHHGMTKDFRLNQNCTIDLALIHFLFKAVIKASKLLDLDEENRRIWTEILDNLADYPVFNTPEGPIFVDIENAHPIMYNYPVPVSPVFPGEEISADSPEEIYDIAKRTCETIQTNGNNSFVTLGMTRARLGLKDGYFLFRNDILTRVRHNGALTTHCNSEWRYCSPLVEGAGITAVMNEMLMQSYDGKIRLFPAFPENMSAKFADLRAVGAFLVSAEIEKGEVKYVVIKSLEGSPCTIINPWKDYDDIRVRNMIDSKDVKFSLSGTKIEFFTQKEHAYVIDRKNELFESFPITKSRGKRRTSPRAEGIGK